MLTPSASSEGLATPSHWEDGTDPVAALRDLENLGLKLADWKVQTSPAPFPFLIFEEQMIFLLREA